MTYKINGIELFVQPTTGQWSPRESFGIAGDGRGMYSGVREFVMRFALLPPSGTAQLQNFYWSGTTGTVVVDLPDYANQSYGFKSYTGASIREPEFDEFFNGYYTGITLLITNIRT